MGPKVSRSEPMGEAACRPQRFVDGLFGVLTACETPDLFHKNSTTLPRISERFTVFHPGMRFREPQLSL